MTTCGRLATISFPAQLIFCKNPELEEEEAGDTTLFGLLVTMDSYQPQSKFCNNPELDKEEEETGCIFCCKLGRAEEEDEGMDSSHQNQCPPRRRTNPYSFWGLFLGQNSCLGILSDFGGYVSSKTPFSDKRRIFAIGETNVLKDLEISHCHIMDENGSVAFMESSQL